MEFMNKKKVCIRFLRKEFGCWDCHNGGNSNCIDYIEIGIEERIKE